MSMSILAITVVLMLVGLIGVVVPVLPGLLLIWLGVLLWSLTVGTTAGWVVFGIVTLGYAVGVLCEYLVPGQRMRRAGVRTSTLVAGVLVAVVGAVLIPVVGAFIGFPLGIYLVQRVRRGSHAAARDATVLALKAIGLNILIELATALLMIAVWVGALVLGVR